MKFAEHLAAHITPEWRKQYIQYEVRPRAALRAPAPRSSRCPRAVLMERQRVCPCTARLSGSLINELITARNLLPGDRGRGTGAVRRSAPGTPGSAAAPAGFQQQRGFPAPAAEER